MVLLCVSCRLDEEEDEVMKRLSSTFSAETNRREEDDRMYVLCVCTLHFWELHTNALDNCARARARVCVCVLYVYVV